MRRLLAVFVLLLAAMPPMVQAAGAEPDMVTSSAKQFVDLLAKKDFAAAVAQFDATMKAALPESKLRETWEFILGKIGPFKRTLGARTEKFLSYDIAFVTCEFAQETLDAKVVFNSKRLVAGLFFVPFRPAGPPTPTYADTNAFREQPATVGSGEWVLPGTLAFPVKSGPWPAVVLVHGSGPQDRDETVMANKPFRDLAWGLATKGIAVLRYEKRTKEYRVKLAGAPHQITLKEETMDDALNAVACLRATKGIDPKRIFVLGHSLGGLAAPRIGKADPSIAGLIILAGSTRPLEDIIVDQLHYLASVAGTAGTEEQARLAEVETSAAKAKALTAADAGNTNLMLGAPVAYWLDLHAYDAPATARALKQPLLILQGQRDYQVTQADFDGWKKALAPSSNATFKLYPKLNHLFIAGEGKSTPAEYEQPGHVAEEVISDIAGWIKSEQEGNSAKSKSLSKN